MGGAKGEDGETGIRMKERKTGARKLSICFYQNVNRLQQKFAHPFNLFDHRSPSTGVSAGGLLVSLSSPLLDASSDDMTSMSGAIYSLDHKSLSHFDSANQKTNLWPMAKEIKDKLQYIGYSFLAHRYTLFYLRYEEVQLLPYRSNDIRVRKLVGSHQSRDKC